MARLVHARTRMFERSPMRLAIAVSAAILLAATPFAASAQGMGGGGGMGGGKGKQGAGQGQGQRAAQMQPIKRKDIDKLVERNFRDADTDRNGMVTIAELRAAIQARKDAAILQRFARIDANGDRIIDEKEFLAWQGKLGATVLAPDAQQVAGTEFVGETIPLELEDKPGAIMLSRLVAPLSVPLLTAANTNYDAGMSLEELLAYHRAKFDALDLDKNGELDRNELRALAPEMREAPASGSGQGQGGQQRGKGKGRGTHSAGY